MLWDLFETVPSLLCYYENHCDQLRRRKGEMKTRLTKVLCDWTVEDTDLAKKAFTMAIEELVKIGEEYFDSEKRAELEKGVGNLSALNTDCERSLAILKCGDTRAMHQSVSTLRSYQWKTKLKFGKWRGTNRLHIFKKKKFLEKAGESEVEAASILASLPLTATHCLQHQVNANTSQQTVSNTSTCQHIAQHIVSDTNIYQYIVSDASTCGQHIDPNASIPQRQHTAQYQHAAAHANILPPTPIHVNTLFSMPAHPSTLLQHTAPTPTHCL